MFKRGLWSSMLFMLIFSCLSLTGHISLLQPLGSSHHETIARSRSCIASSTPGEHSLLIVLLDRSSSLAQTDPEEYSTSITRMLANLWPGRMAIIFFSGTTQQLPQLGPVDLTQSGARALLQGQIEAQKNILNPNTPTQYAVEQAARILVQNQYPRGSEVMLITDGQPFLPSDQDGTQQITAIEQRDAPIFCTHGVPINTFSLGNQLPAYAQAFLHQIATGTAGAYQDVTTPTQLAAPILQLYANWQHLQFVSTGTQHQFFVDTYARQVDFIAFLSNSTTFPVTLLGPDQQPVPNQQLISQAQDIHYQFDQMETQRFNASGTYTIQTSDPSAQTYVLEETRLQLELLSPTSHTSLYAGQPVIIAVAFFDNNNPQQHIHPTSDESVVIGLTYTLRKNGQIINSGEKKLLQQPAPNDDLFNTQITPSSTGTLTLTFSASYQYVPVPDVPDRTIQVSDPPPACIGTTSPCQTGSTGLFILISCLVVLVASGLLFFFLYRRPGPFGFLENAQRSGQGKLLGHNRTLSNRLLHPSTILSTELDGFDFHEAHFRLQFRRRQRLLLTNDQNTPSLAVWCTQKPAGQQMQPVKTGSPVILHEHDRILVHGFPCATFHLDNVSPKRDKPQRI